MHTSCVKLTMALTSRHRCSHSFYSFLRLLNRLEMHHQICRSWISHMAILAHVTMLKHLNTPLHTSILTGYLKVMSLLGWILHIHVQFYPFLYTRSLPHQFHGMQSLITMSLVSESDLNIQWEHSKDDFSVYVDFKFRSTPSLNMSRHVVGLWLQLSCTTSLSI